MNMPFALLKVLVFCGLLSMSAQAQEPEPQEQVLAKTIEQLEKPLYTPFIERYLLDEVKSLRADLQAQRADFKSQLADKQLTLANHSVTYATDTVTYFFYLVAGASSLLLLVGWTSIRDIREKAMHLTDEEVSKLIRRYEARLQSVENKLNSKEQQINQNQSALEQTNEIHSLWLRATQEVSPENKIVYYDQILQLRPDDVEAMTYKADAALELNEPKWATNLCRKALELDQDNGHAYYQLACANCCLEQLDDAELYLEKAIRLSASYADAALEDPLLHPLKESGQLDKLASLAATLTLSATVE